MAAMNRRPLLEVAQECVFVVTGEQCDRFDECLAKLAEHGIGGTDPSLLVRLTAIADSLCVATHVPVSFSSQEPADPLLAVKQSRAHGGGNWCEEPGCEKSAGGSTSRCITHGGGRRCKEPGCDKGGLGPTSCCIAHGGGKRCKEPGCDKSAQYSTSRCAAHGGGKRCEEPGAVSDIAGGGDSSAGNRHFRKKSRVSLTSASRE